MTLYEALFLVWEMHHISNTRTPHTLRMSHSELLTLTCVVCWHKLTPAHGALARGVLTWNVLTSFLAFDFRCARGCDIASSCTEDHPVSVHTDF